MRVITVMVFLVGFWAAPSQSLDAVDCTNAAIQPTTPSNDFDIIGEGDVVRHLTTGLEWRRCVEGRSWTGDGCSAEIATAFSWEGALLHAEQSEGWRLPNIKELLSIVENCRVEPPMNLAVFPDSGYAFWSSSPFPKDSELVFVLDKETSGFATPRFKTQAWFVRLVRDSE